MNLTYDQKCPNRQGLGSKKLFVDYHLFNSRHVSGTSQIQHLIPSTHSLKVHCKTEAQRPAYVMGLRS